MSEPFRDFSWNDPPCWGTEGCALLPAAWADELSEQVVRIESTGRRSKRRLPADILTRTDWFHRVGWEQPPIDVAVGAARELLSRHDSERMLDRTVSLRRPLAVAPEQLEFLPLLATTRAALDANAMTVADGLALLDDRNPVRLLQLLGQLDAFLDLLLTPEHWVEDDSRTADPFADWKPEAERPPPRRIVRRPQVPSDLEEAVLLAQLRHVRTAGGSDLYTQLRTGWPTALGVRAGISLEPSDTLEHAGQAIGVTRERVRQVTKRIAISHGHHRRWGLPTVLDPLHAVLLEHHGRPLEEAGSGLLERLPEEIAGRLTPMLAAERTVALLRTYGVELPTPRSEGQTYLFEAPEPLPDGWDRNRFRKVAWQATRKTGLGRLDDLRLAVRSDDPDLTDEQVDDLMRVGAAEMTLPLGYYLQGSGSHPPSFASTAARIIGALGPLHIEELRIGIQRRYSFRGLGLVPPSEVLLAGLERLPDFIIRGQVVHVDGAAPYPEDTVTGWIHRQVEESPYGALHRLVILDRAKAAGYKLSTVGVYITFGELFTSAGEGSGCITLLGRSVTPEELAAAQSEADLIRIPTNLTVKNTSGGMLLNIEVGTDLRNNGVLSVGAQVARRIGGRRLNVVVNESAHGVMAMSGNLLYGLNGGIRGLDADVGDSILVRIEFAASTAEFSLKGDEGLEG